MATKINIKPGTLLIAEPFLFDGAFKRSVVLITEHRSDGSVGFVLNKPIKMNIQELVASFPDFEAEVFFGGPVATDTIHYIHNVGDLIENSTEITRGVYWGGDFDKIKFLVSTKVIKPSNIKFFVGYSGWSEGQLQEEIDAGTWILDEMYANYAFKENSNLWSAVLDNKGDIFTVISKIPDHPAFN